MYETQGNYEQNWKHQNDLFFYSLFKFDMQNHVIVISLVTAY